ncbi:MAG TPA: dihydrofolate reductase family protein, partial [Gaiellaceae bacterium]|nr:dihydrofolate reductase family protein [Gaiellaceae bacterium]
AFWPNQRAEQNPMAALINSKRKYVVSNTLGTTDWENSTIVGGDLATEIPKLKDRSGGDLLVSGSITLVQSLLAQNLLDELSLMVHPLVLGNGRRLLDSIDGTKRLELVESKSFGSGVVSLAYRRASDGDGTAEQEP